MICSGLAVEWTYSAQTSPFVTQLAQEHFFGSWNEKISFMPSGAIYKKSSSAKHHKKVISSSGKGSEKDHLVSCMLHTCRSLWLVNKRAETEITEIWFNQRADFGCFGGNIENQLMASPFLEISTKVGKAATKLTKIQRISAQADNC